MGLWSRPAGQLFLDWLAPVPGLRWLDVGCGNGAFTELIVERCAPAAVLGIAPSEAQLAFARARPALHAARFHQADAMALPFPGASFDAVVMPLVIFFVPDPARGVAEMARVARPGGCVAAYAWDMYGGGFPYYALHAEMHELGAVVPAPPSPEASRPEVLRALWSHAGLAEIETRELAVSRTFADFDDYWATALGGPSVGPLLAAMAPGMLETLRTRVRKRLPAEADGRIVCSARAQAIRGRVPAQA